MERRFIYAPAVTDSEFRCKVPLKETYQRYIVNGVAQGEPTPFVLDVKKGEAMKEMLQLICIRNADNLEPVSLKETFRFGEGSTGRVLQCSHTLTMDEFKTDEEVEISLAPGARVDFFVMQNEHNRAEHNSSFHISLEEGAVLNMVFVQLHGGVINNTVRIDLNGRHADCNLGGLYLTDTKQLMNNSVELFHHVPECTSRQLFKGILQDEGVAKFYGRITVVPDAQKTEAFQANHNLILSDTAKAFSKPQLEIYADDVKCSHGSTVGRLNEDELFYMRSRGIKLEDARLLQQMAFADEVLRSISSEELRERMQGLVEKRLRGEFSRCSNCSRHCC